jgi:hypothetical protein
MGQTTVWLNPNRVIVVSGPTPGPTVIPWTTTGAPFVNTNARSPTRTPSIARTFR